MTEQAVRTLIVSDDPALLSVLTKLLVSTGEVCTANGAVAGRELADAGAPFGIVIADMELGDSDGVTFLIERRKRWPTSGRVLLASRAHAAAVATSQEAGIIHASVCKPLTREAIDAAVRTAGERFRLCSTEQDLLERTLLGTVAALVQALEAARPDSPTNCGRITQAVRALANELGDSTAWTIELAALISATSEGVDSLFSAQQRLGGVASRAHASAAGHLVAGIPRLERTAGILRNFGLRDIPDYSPLS